MKTFVLILSFFVVGSSLNESSMDGVVNALKRGNATKLSDYFDQTIEIGLGDKRISYSKHQAEVVLRDFFYSNSVKNFEVLRLTNSTSTIKNCVGTLNTVNGLFHTTLCLKQLGNEQVIEQITLQKDNNP